MFDFSESVPAQPGDAIRSHVRSQMEKLLSALRANKANVRLGAD
jgi:hypothetical protein